MAKHHQVRNVRDAPAGVPGWLRPATDDQRTRHESAGTAVMSARLSEGARAGTVARFGKRDGEAMKAFTTFLVDPAQWKILCQDGYRPVIRCPEVQMCIGIYADLISSMTIHLMANSENGDIRIRNELAKKLDVSPSRHMTRTPFMQWIVRTLLGEGEGNAVLIPSFREGLLDDIRPVPYSDVSFRPEKNGDYRICVNGVDFRPDEVLHFVFNPDPIEYWKGRGLSVALKDFVKTLQQANSTRTALMESPSPNLIVKVDGLTEEFASKEGRKKLREQYLDSSENGEPWFIPAEAFSVEKVQPLSIADLAIKDSIELDKRSIAALFGVPPFLVGIDGYSQEAYQHFLATRVAPLAHAIEQELTKKLLYSPEMYFRLNSRSLYNYSMADLVAAGSQMVDRQTLRRNEWRDWLGLPPDPEMDVLLALENYIPANRLGDQKKLNGGGSGADEPEKDE